MRKFFNKIDDEAQKLLGKVFPLPFGYTLVAAFAAIGVIDTVIWLLGKVF